MASKMLPQKKARTNPDSSKLPEIQQKIYDLIKSKENVGIWQSDIKKEITGHNSTAIEKAIKTLEARDLIKYVTSIKNKNKKILMASEFEPSDEISGGAWYQDGELDTEFIKILRNQCKKHIEILKVATCEKVGERIRASSAFKTDISLKQISQIIDLLVLDNEIEKLKSSGRGAFSHIPAGKECYRILTEGVLKGGAFSSIPCGVCPRISECTPDGVISPITCEYYNKWLKIDF